MPRGFGHKAGVDALVAAGHDAVLCDKELRDFFQSLHGHNCSNCCLFAFVAFRAAPVECLLKGINGEDAKGNVYARLQCSLLQTRCRLS